MPKGDVKIVGKSPHDCCILLQEWPDIHGKLTPTVPSTNTVDQSVLLFGANLSIAKEEIEETLNDLGLFPKEVVRFYKSQSTEPTTTVKVSFGSADLKERILSEGFKMYHQSFRVVSFEKNPEIAQCFRCQSFGHTYQECKEEKEKCLSLQK